MAPAAVEVRSPITSPASKLPSSPMAQNSDPILESPFASPSVFGAFPANNFEGDRLRVCELGTESASQSHFKFVTTSVRPARSRPRPVKLRKQVSSREARFKVVPNEGGLSWNPLSSGNVAFISHEHKFADGDCGFRNSGSVPAAGWSNTAVNLNSRKVHPGKSESVGFVFVAKQKNLEKTNGGNNGEVAPNVGKCEHNTGIKSEMGKSGECTENCDHGYSGKVRLENHVEGVRLDNVNGASSREKGEHSARWEGHGYEGNGLNMERERVTGRENSIGAKDADLGNLECGKRVFDEHVETLGSDITNSVKAGKEAASAKCEGNTFVFGRGSFNVASDLIFGNREKAENAGTIDSDVASKREAEKVKVGGNGSVGLREYPGTEFFVFSSRDKENSCSSESTTVKFRNKVKMYSKDSRHGNRSAKAEANKLVPETDFTYSNVMRSENNSNSVFRSETIFTIPDEMKNLNINDSGNDGTEKHKYSSGRISNNCGSSSPPKGEEEIYGCSLNGNQKSAVGSQNSNGLAGFDESGCVARSDEKFVGDCNLSIASFGVFSSESFTFKVGSSGGKGVAQCPALDAREGREQDAVSQLSFSSAPIKSQQYGAVFEGPVSSEVEKKDDAPDGSKVPNSDFQLPKWNPSCFSANLFPSLNNNYDWSGKSRSNRIKSSKKMRGKPKRSTLSKRCQGRGEVRSKSSSKLYVDSPECYSPMDFSPYQEETAAVDQNLREVSVATGDSDEVNCSVPVAPTFTSPTVEKRDSSFVLTEQVNNKYVTVNPVDGIFVHDCPSGIVTSAATASASVKEQESSNNAGPEAGFGSNAEEKGSGREVRFCFASGLEDMGENKFTFGASSGGQGNISAVKRKYKRKNRKKVGHISFVSSPRSTAEAGTSAQLSSSASMSEQSRKINKPEAEQLNAGHFSFSAEIQGNCEKLRLRGNQAYKNGDLSKAEDLYTQGILSVPSGERFGSCLKSLLLCYSNRAATRMCTGRIGEALGDCEMAIALDPDFLKVRVRAGNCHLLLGEVENAVQCYNGCLESGAGVCLDRKLIIEAADGLQKALKVDELTSFSAKLLEEGNSEAARSALEMISEVLAISLYSEKLLRMKAEALHMLRKYDESIQLCEQSLHFAEKNSATSRFTMKTVLPKCQNPVNFRLWRWFLISKSYFYLGRLEEALDLLQKVEGEGPSEVRSKDLEQSISLADTIRELLRCKNAGNEAFRSAKYTEAVQHYTAALSKNFQSRNFAAICLCNRAAAYKALGQIADAIADCSLSAALDNNYIKAISRRADLYEMIRDYGQAASDLQKVILVLRNQYDEKGKLSGTAGRTPKSVELRKAQKHLNLMEENAKKELSSDLYLILGVKSSEAASDIKKAYRKAALRHHPDKAGQFLARSECGDDALLWKEISDEVNKEADRLFKIIGEAYAVLSDPNKRAEYDLGESKRKAASKSKGNGGRTSDDAYESPFERTFSRRNSRENWKTWGNSHSRW